MTNFTKADLPKNSQDLLDSFEERARTFGDFFSRLVGSMENIEKEAMKFFGSFQQQKQRLADFSHTAVENVAPALEMGRLALVNGKNLGGKIVNKGRAHPTAVVAGAFVVFGAIAFLTYLMRERDEESVDSAEAKTA